MTDAETIAAIKKAWSECQARIEHDFRCGDPGPKQPWFFMQDKPNDDPRCTCGLRELALLLKE